MNGRDFIKSSSLLTLGFFPSFSTLLVTLMPQSVHDEETVTF